MCTAVAYRNKNLFFGRTLDYEASYGEEVVMMPRNFSLNFRHMGRIDSHYAICGMAHVVADTPLYYDAMNEKGLCMAGLNFVGNAVYSEKMSDGDNVAAFEFIPWILCQCATMNEVRDKLKNICIMGEKFNEQLPVASLHWMISDSKEDIVVECMKDGIHVHDNPVGVMTNNPPFPQQMLMLSRYRGLSKCQPENLFSDKTELLLYSRGMGAMGLPGDLSSGSRFARAAFMNMNSVSDESENSSVSQFFHIMETVVQPRGCCQVAKDEYEITIYTACCSASSGVYYYKTYDNSRIVGVDMRRENQDGAELLRFPLDNTEIHIQN